MKRPVAALAIGSALCMSIFGSARTSADTQPPVQHPTIEFVTPHANDVIKDYPIYIETKVTDFKLESPVQYWSVVDQSNAYVGHIHYTLDDSPIFATARTKVMMGKPEGRSLPLGKHILRAELVYINHDSMRPKIVAEIPIVCERPGEKADTGPTDVMLDSRARKELESVEDALREVQQKLSDVKAHSRSAPDPKLP